MATYSFVELLHGYNGKREDLDSGESWYYTPEKCTVLTEIVCEEGECELIIPSHTGDNKPVTHVGYRQKFEKGYENWTDWHHCKGGVRVPDHYGLEGISLKLPASIGRIVIPKTVTDISPDAFEGLEGVTFEVDPENTRYCVVDNKIVGK